MVACPLLWGIAPGNNPLCRTCCKGDLRHLLTRASLLGKRLFGNSKEGADEFRQARLEVIPPLA